MNKNKNKDAYNRLSEIVALLMSERFPEGISISGIGKILDVPVEVLVNDMLALTLDERVESSLLINGRPQASKWREALKRRETDAFEIPVRLDIFLFMPEEAGDVIALNLLPFEKNVLAQTAGEASRLDSRDPVRIKNPAFDKDEIPGVTGPLQIAIEKRHPVTFVYENDEKNEGFIPVSIYRDQFRKKVYLAGRAGGGRLVLKRIDRIKSLKVHYDENVPELEMRGLELFDYLWGADIEPGEVGQICHSERSEEDRQICHSERSEEDGQICHSERSEESPDLLVKQHRIIDGYVVRHVKIKIYKETGNILEKIKTETGGRRFGKLYDDPSDAEVAYYEDDVCGMGSFKRWLLGYGASVYVLEPVELAQEMYDIAVRRLRLYRE